MSTLIPNRDAIWLFDSDLAASSTMLARVTSRWAAVWVRTSFLSRWRSDAVKMIWQARKAGTGTVLHEDHKE